MSFDSKKFMRTKFTARTESVPVPDLQAFFPEGVKAVWTVRGLTGQELARVREAPARYKKMAAMIEGIMSSVSKEIIESVKTALGTGTHESPEDIAIRIEQLVIASVEPQCTIDVLVKLCEVSAITFYDLTNRISILTGQGQMPGKQPPSGATEKSEPPSPSVTSEGGSSLKPGRMSSRKDT